jgi:phage terminase small subunit
MLTPKQQRFVDEYLVDLNATAAYKRAGYAARGNAAEVNASRLLRDAQVSAAVEEARAEVARKLQISAERVVAEAWHILTADTRELVEYRIGCCRYCYGIDFRYQRTVGEMERDRVAHALAGEEAQVRASKVQADAAFDEQGGVGFDARREPSANCLECFGRGVGQVQVNDTRTLSPAAVALYAGVKQTREGIEVKLHSKLDALEKLARHLGLYDRIKVGADTAAQLTGQLDSTLTDQGRAVVAAAVAGELPLSQAAQLITGLGALAKLVETDELAARIAALEKKHGHPEKPA